MGEGGVRWGASVVLVAAMLARSPPAAAEEPSPPSAAASPPTPSPPASDGMSPGPPAEAAPPADVSKVECVGRHEDAQVVRRQGKLLAARSALLVCSRVSCPPAIRADCVDW